LKLLVHLVGVATTAVVAVGGTAVGGAAVGGTAVVGTAVGGTAVVGTDIGGTAVVGIDVGGTAVVGTDVGAGVSVMGVSIGVSVKVGVSVSLPLTSITTSTISPNVIPESSAKRQLPVYVPAVIGAVNDTDTFPCPPGATELLTVPFPPLIELPLKNRMVKLVSHVQEPVFWSVHVLIKV